MESVQKERVFSYDLMRVMACLAVILILVCDYIVKIYSPYSIEFKIANFIDKYENKLSTKFKDLIFKFSGLSFGVYICHFAVLSFVRNYIRLTDYNILVYIVLVFGCTVLLTTLLVLVLSKIKYVKSLVSF